MKNGFTKLKGEQIIKRHFKTKKKGYAILRYFNVVGASPSKKIGQINKADQLFKNFSLTMKKKSPVAKPKPHCDKIMVQKTESTWWLANQIQSK